MPSGKIIFKSELELTTKIFDQLVDQSILAFQEVPMLGRSIDLVLLKNSKVISIEFKMNNWKKAMSQAKDYLLASDFVYICMPRRRISADFVEELKVNGVGLLFPQLDSEWPFEEVVKARQSEKKWKVARKNLRSYLREHQVR